MEHLEPLAPATETEVVPSVPAEYEAPTVEAVVTSEDLEREAFYAGSVVVSVPLPD